MAGRGNRTDPEGRGALSAPTRATELLTQLGIAYTVRRYEHDPRAVSYGREASEALGVPADQIFKTLVADVDGKLIVAVVPVAGNLDLKALAAAVGGKKATMADPAQAERASGYVTGGISPIGLRRHLPVVVDESAMRHRAVLCSAGQRGMQVQLAPADLLTAARAKTASIAT